VSSFSFPVFLRCERQRRNMVPVSLTLPICISGLALAPPSSGQKLTPVVFAFDSEAARKGLHDCTVGGGYAPRLESLVVPATMGTRGRTSGERLPAGPNQATVGCSFDRSVRSADPRVGDRAINRAPVGLAIGRKRIRIDHGW
jgi:hypothetical protein